MGVRALPFSYALSPLSAALRKTADVPHFFPFWNRASCKEPVQILSRFLCHWIRYHMIGKTASHSPEKFSHFLFGERRPSIGLMPQEGDRFFLRAELPLVSHQPFLVHVAQTEVQKSVSAIFSLLDPFPDQQVVRPVRKIVGKRGVEFVVQRILPLQEEIARHNLVPMNRQKKESLLRETKPLVRKRHVIVQAAQIDGTMLRQELIDQYAPGLRVTDQRVAVIGERQGHNPFAKHICDAAERNSGPRLSGIIHDHVSAGLPAVRVGQHSDPARRVKNTAFRFLDQGPPQRICSRIYTHDFHVDSLSPKFTFGIPGRFRATRWRRGTKPELTWARRIPVLRFAWCGESWVSARA